MDPILLCKTFTATTATTEDGHPGEFRAIVSAFGNEDSQGDIVEKGAFAATLKEWRDRGRPIPVVWSHMFHEPENFLGEYIDAEETEAGLELTGVLDLEHPKAARVHKLMKKGLIVEFSISGKVRDYEVIEKDEDDDDSWWFPPIRIKDIDLWEAGPCFKGANPNTELLSVKANGAVTGGLARAGLMKEGRVLAQKHVDALKEAHEKLGAIISAVEKSPEPEDATAGEKTVQQAAVLTPKVRALLDLNTIH